VPQQVSRWPQTSTPRRSRWLRGAATSRALAIREAVYGPDHPEVANDLYNLGIVLRELGDLSAARAALERALAIGEAAGRQSDKSQ
jgi:Tfp pilus assembly protein PilF